MYDDLDCSFIIANISDEMFNDALFYKELAEKSEDIFKTWRFYRSALINYCISVETWVNKLLVKGLEQKKKQGELEDIYKKLYITLTEDLDFPLPGINLSIRKKFKEYLPKLYDFKIEEDSALDTAIDQYIEITKYRNKIIHYSPGNYRKVYNTDELKDCIDNAPNYIEKLFDELYKQSNKLKELGYPSWFKEKKSRNI